MENNEPTLVSEDMTIDAMAIKLADKKLRTAETSMMVSYLANSEKLVSESKIRSCPIVKKESEHLRMSEKEKIFSRKDDHHEEKYEHIKDKYNDEPHDNKGHDDDDLLLRKLDLLRKLSELKANGVILSSNYNMQSDISQMEYEYNLHFNIRSKKNTINWLSSMMTNCVYGVEMLNEKFNPFDFHLKGWAEQMNADVGDYNDVFGELYEKYNQPGRSVPPELKLLLLVTGSAIKFHLVNSYITNMVESRTGLKEGLDNDPTLAEKLKQRFKDNDKKGKTKIDEKYATEHAGASQRVVDINALQRMQQDKIKRDAEYKSGSDDENKPNNQPDMDMPDLKPTQLVTNDDKIKLKKKSPFGSIMSSVDDNDIDIT